MISIIYKKVEICRLTGFADCWNRYKRDWYLVLKVSHRRLSKWRLIIYTLLSRQRIHGKKEVVSPPATFENGKRTGAKEHHVLIAIAPEGVPPQRTIHFTAQFMEMLFQWSFTCRLFSKQSKR